MADNSGDEVNAVLVDTDPTIADMGSDDDVGDIYADMPVLVPEVPLPSLIVTQHGAGRDSVGTSDSRTPPTAREHYNVNEWEEPAEEGLFDLPPANSEQEGGAVADDDWTGGHPLEHFFTIHETTQSESTSRNTKSETSRLSFHDWGDAHDPIVLFETIVTRLYSQLLRDHADEEPSHIGMELMNPYMTSPFYIPPRPPSQNSPRTMTAAFENLVQSGKKIRLFEVPLDVRLFAVWPLRGRESGGCANADHRTTARASSLIPIYNSADQLCMLRAVCVGIETLRFENADITPATYRSFIAPNSEAQRAAAFELAALLSIDAHQPAGITELQRVQAHLDTTWPQRYRLAAFSKEHQYRLLWRGEQQARHRICLYLEGGHWSYIGHPAQLFNAQHYCLECCRVIYYRTSHPLSCPAVCRRCFRSGWGYPCGASNAAEIYCKKCRFTFATRECYDYHLRNTPPSINFEDGRGNRRFASICEAKFRCAKCGLIHYQRMGKHKCRVEKMDAAVEDECKRCGAVHSKDYPYCYIQPLETDGQAGKDALRYVFFDAESEQTLRVEINRREVKKHVPNLICAEVLCQSCIRAGITTNERDAARVSADCVCGISTDRRYRTRRGESNQHYSTRQLTFNNFDDAERDVAWAFLTYLFETGPRRAKTIVISHNGGKYDIHLLLEAMYCHNVPVRVVSTGLKIYVAEVRGLNRRHVIFKDSYNFFFAPLAALRSSFALESEADEKPHFPHLFNKRKNLDKRLLHLPDLKYYQVEHMKPAAKQAFMRWYEEAHATTPFHLREQLLDYCRNDVRLLRAACLRYRAIIEEIAGLDPFESASTLAKLALAIFRKKFLRADTLVNAPEGGYRANERQSAAALKWLRLYEKRHGVSVRTSEWCIGEARVDDSGMRLDGLVKRSDGQRPLALEFLGCYYHGCPTCFSDRTMRLAGGRTAEELHEHTMQRIHTLTKRRGYEVEAVWECDFKRELASSAAMRAEYREMAMPSAPLNLRTDALFGGRVEPFRLHYKCQPGIDEIVAVDICSLYPWVMKHCEFPVGNPKILTRETILVESPLPWTRVECNHWKGFYHVRVLPPQDLLRPLLPYRTAEGQLTFTCCARCSELKQQTPCRHAASQRAWIAGYTHVELNKALSLGYRVIDIYEIWDYAEWASRANGNGLFDAYIDCWLKMKVESSGWEKLNAHTDEEKRQFCDDYKRAEGIDIDAANVKHNPSCLSISKLNLNSLWGKLAQRAERVHTVITSTPEEFHRVLNDATLAVCEYTHLNDQLDRITYRKVKELADAPRTNCLPVACFVTSHARLRLYKFIEEAERACAIILYCDTDSLYYARRIGAPGIIEGRLLGDMVREMALRWVCELIAAGAKNYAYVHCAPDGSDPQATLKVRGLQLTCSARQLITFEKMKRLIYKKYLGQPQTSTTAQEITIAFPQISRSKHADVYTTQATKTWRVVYSKGRVTLPYLITQPFGYKSRD